MGILSTANFWEALLESLHQLPILTDQQAVIMEEAVAWANTWENSSTICRS